MKKEKVDSALVYIPYLATTLCGGLPHPFVPQWSYQVIEPFSSHPQYMTRTLCTTRVPLLYVRILRRSAPTFRSTSCVLAFRGVRNCDAGCVGGGARSASESSDSYYVRRSTDVPVRCDRGGHTTANVYAAYILLPLP